jgi:L-fucose isomerase-like protein
MHADPVAMHRKLGAELLHLGLAEFQDRFLALDAARTEQDVQEVLQMQLAMGPDVTRNDLEPNSRYFLAISDLMREENLSALAIRCWPELPTLLGHWPYLAMMRLAEQGGSVALEGDVDAAILGRFGATLGIGTGYVSDWLAHNESSITLWHPGHAPRDYCVPESLRLGRHFNNDKPLVVNAVLRPDQDVTLARLWRCDDGYHMTAFVGRTRPVDRPLLGAHGVVQVRGESVPQRFERLCRAGMPHHVTVFRGDHVSLLQRLAERLQVTWVVAS